ncbi:LysR family transcriptional regulator [Sessilibacter sp. MAH1]
MLVSDLNIVLKVAEFKSIKKAAESLDLLTATASAALMRVEKSLGVELFQRTTRQLKLSPAGERFIPQIEQAVLLLTQIQQNSKNDLGVIDGEIRLAAPSDFGRNVVLEWLDDFMEQYPKVSLKLHISDSNVDFYREPVDIALRYAPPKDSRMYGFKICDIPRILCASPSYLNQFEPINNLQDLALHNGLFYQLHDIIYDVWEFEKNGKKTKIKMQGNRATNDADLVRRWCVSGKGIAVKSALDISTDLLSGKLVKLLPDYTPKPTELWLICPTKQLITPAIRCLREHITERCDRVLKELKRSQLL